ncbi:MAG: xanthine dehydrogenase family protein subunit M [Deltaproteobacteria bacterium]|nr:xanthine dehydrogenase family protein subunit M [Deltaproteobacteria bacterium]
MRFEYFEPSSIEEAREVLRRGNGQYKILAGGTDIINQLRRRAVTCEGLVNIKRLPGIGSWSAEPGKGLHIGATTLMRELETSRVVAERFPSLVDSLKVIGSIQLRNIATIGGNLCNASPAADTAPSFIVLGASATFLDGGSIPQTVPIEEFFAGPGRSILATEGLLLRVDVPEPERFTGDGFERLTPRSAMDIAIASAASRVTLDTSSGRVVDAAIALGAVAPRPLRARKAEDVLRGKEPTPELLAKAGATAKEECNPIDDLRGTAAYRRAMIAVLVRRTLEKSIERANRRAGT